MNEGPQKRPSGSLGALAALSLACVVAFPSASACQKRSDDLRNCDIPALFQSSCDGSLCHGSETPRADLDLVSPGLEGRLFHVPATKDCDKRPLIFPGNPSESVLYLKVSSKKPFCGRRMPIDRELSSSELACLKNYIELAGTDTDGQDCETCGTIQCINFNTDLRHCGGCGQACADGTVCAQGTCENPCTSGTVRCGIACSDLATDEDNCGVCGHRCGAGSTCLAGVCECDSTGDPGEGAAGAPALPPVSGISLAGDLLPIIEKNCAGTDCHDSGSEDSALWLLPDTAFTALVDVTSESCGAKKFVVPQSPDTSYLIEKLVGGNLCEGARMPLDENPLSPANVQKFVTWICEGAQNN